MDIGQILNPEEELALHDSDKKNLNVILNSVEDSLESGNHHNYGSTLKDLGFKQPKLKKDREEKLKEILKIVKLRLRDIQNLEKYTFNLPTEQARRILVKIGVNSKYIPYTKSGRNELLKSEIIKILGDVSGKTISQQINEAIDKTVTVSRTRSKENKELKKLIKQANEIQTKENIEKVEKKIFGLTGKKETFIPLKIKSKLSSYQKNLKKELQNKIENLLLISNEINNELNPENEENLRIKFLELYEEISNEDLTDNQIYQIENARKKLGIIFNEEEPTFSLISESSFHGYKEYYFDLRNVNNLSQFYEVSKKAAEQYLGNRPFFMKFELIDNAGKFFRTIPANSTHTFTDFENRLNDIINNNIPGSDIPAQNPEINFTNVTLATADIQSGLGKSKKQIPDFAIIKDVHYELKKKFNKIIEKYGYDGSTAPGNCLYECIKYIDKLNDTTIHKKISKHIEDFNEIKDWENLKVGLYFDTPDNYPEINKNKMFIREEEIMMKNGKKKENKYYQKFYCSEILKIDESIKNISKEEKAKILLKDKHFSIITGIKKDEFYLDSRGDVFDKDFKLIRKRIQEFMVKNKKPYERKIVIFDFETTSNFYNNGFIKPYSISFMIYDEIFGLNFSNKKRFENDPKKTKKEYNAEIGFFYGENCCRKFVEKLKKSSDNTMFILVGYNNSRFDNFLLLDELNRQDMVNSVNFQNSSILDIKFSGRHCTFDICRFTMSSLKKCCEDFHCKFQKIGDFNHTEVQAAYNEKNNINNFFHEKTCKFHDSQEFFTYENFLNTDLKIVKNDNFKPNLCDCEKLRKLIEYNIFDCLATAEIYERISLEVTYDNSLEIPQKRLKKEFFDYKTIGSVIWELFENENSFRKLGKFSLTENIEENNNKKRTQKLNMIDYKNIRNSLVAGRSQAFKGVFYDDKNEYCCADVKSMYPYVMLNREFPIGDITRGYFKKCFENDYIGFFPCKFNQKNLQKKIIPRREKGIPLDWNYEGEINTWLSSVDIKCLERHGVEVKKGKGFYFKDKISGKDLFHSLLNFKKMKEEEDKKIEKKDNSYNEVRRQMAKLFLNSLSGKVIERPHSEKTVMVRSRSQMEEILGKTKNGIKIVNILTHGKGIISYEIDEKTALKETNRPIYLGVLIYAYAREHLYENTINKYDVIYCDTDSAFIKKSELDDLKNSKLWCYESNEISAVGSNFGQFEHEKSAFFDTITTIAAKNYFCFTKGKLAKKGFKGININKDKLIPDDKISELNKLSKEENLEELFNYYNYHFRDYSLDKVENIRRFIEKIRRDESNFVLTSSLQKIIRHIRKTDHFGIEIRQRFLVKEISTPQNHF